MTTLITAARETIFKQTRRRWTNMLYGSRNAFCVTGLIIKSVFFSEQEVYFLKVLRLSFPVVGPSDSSCSLARFATENIKNFWLVLCAREKFGARLVCKSM